MNKILSAAPAAVSRACSMAILAATCTSAALASPIDVASSTTIPMHGAVNTMGEHCRAFEQGGTVNFSFSSPTPVDFNVHYHTDSDTAFPLEVSDVAEHQGQFVAEAGRVYCFMWVNQRYSDEEWLIEFEYRQDDVEA